MPIIDLHAHTKFSDGTTSPAEVVWGFLQAGVKLMSVTDHDTLEALPQAKEKAQGAGIPFINGVEISCIEHDHLHILGYKIDINNKPLQDFLAQNRAKRDIRIRKIIAQLAQSGIDISDDDVYKLVKTVASRAHVADALKNKGFVSSRQEAFRKYLVPGKAGYVPQQGSSVFEVISTIKKAGGYAFIAHPGIVKEIWDFPAWVSAGLDGIEVYYPSHSFEMKQDLLYIAQRYKLMVSAGSDHHGAKSGRDNRIGMDVPQQVYEDLKAKLC